MDLNELQKIAGCCTLCELHKGRKASVFARGNPDSSIMILGMCPGPDENVVGSPFVGRAGKVLDEVLYNAFTVDDNLSSCVYITNIVKCFVKPGIKLEEYWIDICLPYFLVQLCVIKPKVIIGLGGDVCNYLLNSDIPIGKLRDSVYEYMGFKLICSYHPSYLARKGGSKHPDFSKVVKDFRKAIDLV